MDVELVLIFPILPEFDSVALHQNGVGGVRAGMNIFVFVVILQLLVGDCAHHETLRVVEQGDIDQFLHFQLDPKGELSPRCVIFEQFIHSQNALCLFGVKWQCILTFVSR